MAGRIGALKYIVIHHPADDNITKTLSDYVKPPYVAAPYDYWIEYPDGDVVVGRPLTMRGAHVIPDYPDYADINNGTAIGVAFEGNFDNDRPPIRPSDAQLERGAALVGRLCVEWGIHPSRVYPHRVVSRTACPGRHFMALWPQFIGKTKWYWLRGLQQAKEGASTR